MGQTRPFLIAIIAVPAIAVQYTPHGFGCLDGPLVGLPTCDPSLPIETRVSNLISLLTTEEKIGLTGSFTGDLCSDIDAGVPRLHIPNVTQLIEITGTVSSSCYVDNEGISYCPTVFPAPLALAASFSRPLWRQKGAVTGIEASSCPLAHLLFSASRSAYALPPLQARAFNNLHVPRIYSPLNFVDLLGFGPDINLIMDPRNGRNGKWRWHAESLLSASHPPLSCCCAALLRARIPRRTLCLREPTRRRSCGGRSRGRTLHTCSSPRR